MVYERVYLSVVGQMRVSSAAQTDRTIRHEMKWNKRRRMLDYGRTRNRTKFIQIRCVIQCKCPVGEICEVN